jgi:O-acetyl-ADP-ribose deacetylase (regulator of RNase III)
MKIVKGDLIKMGLNGDFDVITHGCNCFWTMGAGIAKQIEDIFPEAMIADQKTTFANRDKLGTLSYAIVKNAIGKNLIVVNAYTQFEYTRDKVDVEYDALRKCFQNIKQSFSGKRIGYPKIGAGLAGGDWNIISKIIDEELKDEDHTLVLWEGNK